MTWTHLSEGMPDKPGKYLVYIGGDILIAELRFLELPNAARGFPKFPLFLSEDGYIIDGISHWRKMPLGPRGSNK
jgi:hypothetical protein